MVLTNLFAGQEWEMQMQRRDPGHREGGMLGGASGDMYTPVCKTASHWALLYDAGNPRRAP